MRRATLPFGIENIAAINWSVGDEFCIIKYFDPRSEKNHTRKVHLDEMNYLRPNFRRFLACAEQCCRDSVNRHKRIAKKIQQWHDLLRGKPTDRAYLLHYQGLWEWSYLRGAKLSLAREDTISGSTLRYLRLEAPATYDLTIDYALMEANCPGFTERSDMLCAHHQLSHLAVARMNCHMLLLFAHAVLQINASNFLGQVRTCAAVNMQADDMINLLESSVDNKNVEIIALPSLEIEPAW